MLSVESRETGKKGTGNSGIPFEQAISGVCVWVGRWKVANSYGFRAMQAS